MLESETHQSRRRHKSLWDRIWRDRHGDTVIYQTPNFWLIAWAVMDVISLFAPSKTVASVSWDLGAACLIIWSLLEIFKGVNYFRRALGLFVLILAIAGLLGFGL